MNRNINCATVTLIPKVKNPATVKEFRPISCCKVLYKIISKILTNRIQSIMDMIVDPNQATFVPGRIISDNIVLGYELVKGYKRTNILPRCMIKVAMKKVYDLVEWPFLEQVLHNLQFPIGLLSGLWHV